MLANELGYFYYECLDVAFHLHGRFLSLEGKVSKAVELSIKEAQEETEFGKPIISEILNFILEKQDDLAEKALAFHDSKKKDKREDDHSAAMISFGRSVSGRALSYGSVAAPTCPAVTPAVHHAAPVPHMPLPQGPPRALSAPINPAANCTAWDSITCLHEHRTGWPCRMAASHTPGVNHTGRLLVQPAGPAAPLRGRRA